MSKKKMEKFIEPKPGELFEIIADQEFSSQRIYFYEEDKNDEEGFNRDKCTTLSPGEFVLFLEKVPYPSGPITVESYFHIFLIPNGKRCRINAVQLDCLKKWEGK